MFADYGCDSTKKFTDDASRGKLNVLKNGMKNKIRKGLCTPMFVDCVRCLHLTVLFHDVSNSSNPNSSLNGKFSLLF